MKRKLAVLISLLVFVFVSAAQAGEADPRTSPLASPLRVPSSVVTPVTLREYQADQIKAIRLSAEQVLELIGALP